MVPETISFMTAAASLFATQLHMLAYNYN